MDSTAYRIDKSLLAGMTDAQRALWNETCARALSTKLDEATTQRNELRRDRNNTELIFRRFVAEEGQEAALAAFLDGDFQRHIGTLECDAVIWFSDVKGFSQYAKGKPADAVGRVIRKVMDIQAAAIRDAGGQIDKFMGDGLMAFWKAPDRMRLEVAAEKAAAAAIACAANLRDHFEAESLPCDIRIGLHAGTVIIGDFGGGDRVAFTLIGDAVNTASRYEQAAKCVENKELGRVRVSEEIFSMLSDERTKSTFDPTPRSLPDKHGTCFPARVANV
jgi:class 3 adenylate cyclase